MKCRLLLTFIALTSSASFAHGQSGQSLVSSEDVFRKRGEDLFQTLDVDNDGYLIGEEIPGDIRALLNEAKARPDTQLNLREFQEYREVLYRFQVTTSFKSRDPDKNGFLQKHEVPLLLLKHLGKYSSGGDRVYFQDYLKFCRDRDFPPPPMRRAEPAQATETSPPIHNIDNTDLDNRPTVNRAGKFPKGLPEWFKTLDTDGDGQISLFEWRKGGKKISDFKTYDLNDDGLITAEEVLRFMKKPFVLKLKDGRAKFEGSIEEAAEERYRGKKSFQIFTIKLEQGKTYQIDLTSKVFQAFLHLEDSEGNVLKENSSPSIGGDSRIVFRANTTQTCRLIATSLAGHRTGAFLLRIRLKDDD
jgi:Ca2+-binding EF-hand superfamily protein